MFLGDIRSIKPIPTRGSGSLIGTFFVPGRWWAASINPITPSQMVLAT
jgi:hypothetical protein